MTTNISIIGKCEAIKNVLYAVKSPFENILSLSNMNDGFLTQEVRNNNCEVGDLGKWTQKIGRFFGNEKNLRTCNFLKDVATFLYPC